MSVVVGTSGFSYKNWRGVFYPEWLPQSRWIEFYARHFNAVELNFSFYRVPSESSILKLAEKAPSLSFSLKLHRSVTHRGRLEAELAETFLNIKNSLGKNFFCFVAQFPKSFEANEENFSYILKLKEVFKDIVFELRSPSWEDKAQKFFESELDVVMSLAPQKVGWSRFYSASKIFYARFHGKNELYKGSYGDEEFENVIETAFKSCALKFGFFFNNTADASAVKDAERFKRILSEKLPQLWHPQG